MEAKRYAPDERDARIQELKATLAEVEREVARANARAAALEAVNADLEDALDKESERLVEVERERDEADANAHQWHAAADLASKALAASQAEVAALRREIGAVVCDTDAAGMHSDTCWRCLLLARSVVPGSTDALREFGVKVAQLMAEEAARCESGGFAWPTNDAIVDSILAGGGR